MHEGKHLGVMTTFKKPTAESPRGRGLCAAVDRGPEAGQRRRNQVLHHLPPRKTAVEPQELQAEPHGDQTLQEGTPHTIHGLRGPHTPERQGSAAASAHGRGRGRGEKVWRAPLGCATADFVVLGRLDRAVLRHAEQRTGHAAPAVAPAVGPPARQQRMPMACEGLQVATLLRPRAQDRRSRRGACTRMTGWGDGAARGRSTPQDAPQVTALHRPWHGQRQLVQGVAGQGVHLFALHGILRGHRQRDSPSEGRGLFLSLSERPCLFQG